MSLPPIISARFTGVPESGKWPLNVDFQDGSLGYDVIEETGNAPDAIIESGSNRDKVIER
jgi:hypothetical protein